MGPGDRLGSALHSLPWLPRLARLSVSSQSRHSRWGRTVAHVEPAALPSHAASQSCCLPPKPVTAVAGMLQELDLRRVSFWQAGRRPGDVVSVPWPRLLLLYQVSGVQRPMARGRRWQLQLLCNCDLDAPAIKRLAQDN